MISLKQHIQGQTNQDDCLTRYQKNKTLHEITNLIPTLLSDLGNLLIISETAKKDLAGQDVQTVTMTVANKSQNIAIHSITVHNTIRLYLLNIKLQGKAYCTS